MAVATQLQNYLQQRSVYFDTRHHPYTESSIGAARTAGVPLQQMAKAVLTEDHEGRHLLAVIPADRQLSLFHLGNALHRRFQLVSEESVVSMFNDCVLGAVPAIGAAYHLDSAVDDALLHQDDIYFEAGDHEELVHLSGQQFRALVHENTHGHFSVNRDDTYRYAGYAG